MSRAVLSIGSNLGDRLAHLQSAVDGLGPLVRAVSPVYETAPWGPVPQGDYLNAIVLAEDTDDAFANPAPDDPRPDNDDIDDGGDGDRGGDVRRASGLAPIGWLRRAQALERAEARVRGVRFGPRTLDVDVVTVDAVVQDDPVLTLPHPRAAERAFVLVPWLAVDPAAHLPGLGPVRDLLAALADADRAGVRRREDLRLRRPAASDPAASELPTPESTGAP